MLTSRGWWLLIVILAILALGVLARITPLLLLGLCLLIWFCFEWLLFTIRSQAIVPRLTFTREVHDQRGPVDTLWSGRIFTVRITAQSGSPPGSLQMMLTDWMPLAAEHVSGSAIHEGPLEHGKIVQILYRIRCLSVGRMRFEGVRLAMSDPQGLFRQTSFLRCLAEYRVLPPLVDHSGQPASTKRHSLLPPPGIHRLRRPGSSSELLDLRDYLPGDPPKNIAWKVSARRNRLITKEFESEVPIRCTLFLDTSNAVRLGPPGQNALARLLGIAAAIAQANSGTRDLTGLCLFDEESARAIRPARTSSHLAHLLRVLTDTADLAPTTGTAPVEELLPLGHTLAQEMYPDLLLPSINRMPFWMPWLWPIPEHSAWRPGFWRRLWRWLFFLVCAMAYAGWTILSLLLLETARAIAVEGWPDGKAAINSIFDGLVDVLPVPILLGALLYFWVAVRVYRAIPLFLSARRRRMARWRKKMAAFLSVRFGLAPGGLGLLLEHDGLLSLYLQRFLAEHHVPYRLPLYDAQGRYLFASPAKIDVLSSALIQAIARGRDNELYVLLVDLLELDEQLTPLLRAVGMAMSHHHQVVIVCPWPPGVPWQSGAITRWSAGGGVKSSGGGPAQPTASASPSWLQEMIDLATTVRLQRAFRNLRQQFARLGVPVVHAQHEDPVAMILKRIERLRLAGRKR